MATETPTQSKTHTCDAECFAYIIRYGEPEGCNIFVAEAAANRANR